MLVVVSVWFSLWLWSKQRRVPVSMAAMREAPTASSQVRDRYRLMDEGTGLGALAKGSFGRIYVAVDTQTGHTVAVKRQQVPSRTGAKPRVRPKV